jgi:hypothetical protein
MNIRTVHSYNIQRILYKQYDSKLEKPYELSKKKGIISGALTAFTQSVLFIAFSLVFYISYILLVTYDLNFGDMMIAAYDIIYMSKVVGYNLQFMASIAESIHAA